MYRTVVFGSTTIGREAWRPDRHNAVTVVFGDARIDFRQAELGEVTNLRVVSVFGDIKITIPEGLAVDLNGVTVLSDRKVVRRGAAPDPDAGKVLNIHGTVVLSDMTVRDKP
jgi:predicted membrane protein